MIKSNELRIGNWVELNGKYRRMDTKLLFNHQPYYSNPIPLTPDILEKSGFRHRLGNTDTIHEYFIGTNPLTNDWLFDLCYIDSIGHRKFFYRNGHHTVTYVHQLQNLYFALTGEELNVNL